MRKIIFIIPFFFNSIELFCQSYADSILVEILSKSKAPDCGNTLFLTELIVRLEQDLRIDTIYVLCSEAYDLEINKKYEMIIYSADKPLEKKIINAPLILYSDLRRNYLLNAKVYE
jgi:hypothetical protein